MTRRERWQIWWFVIAACTLTGTINWAIGQQESQRQQRLALRGDFDVIEFENGSVWYLRQDSMNAIWAIPRDQQEKLGGTKTKVYGAGYEISIPYEVTEILDQVYEADIEELEELRRRIREHSNVAEDAAR